jgi:hypothetical protein
MIQPGVSTWYFVTMTADNGSATDSVMITVRPLPEVDLGADTSICGNWEIELDGGDQGIAYIWSTGETTQTITVDSLTSFAGYGERELYVTTYAANKCSNSDTIVVDVKNCTGINEISKNVSVNVFPNPGSGQFNIDLNVIENEIVDVFVINQSGVIIFNKEGLELEGQHTVSVNLEGYASGVYQLFVRSQKGVINKKVVVK